MARQLDHLLLGLVPRVRPLDAQLVARISRGRCGREICLTVAVLAPLSTNLWFARLGGSGLAREFRALQSLIIVTAAPVSLVLLVPLWSMPRALR